ncbi:hypothetical protein CYLTODRAFT_493187 [Cylindrobasidium torrendii FP15055 ss-10]|uniref:Uncharacterized protein n=1 Tax=Cylindrobasidium torrendii FP15055 ss-10 TaxID=1314674 RepID=A0A0D7B1K8_9AGAR|nr:hypothetical protein CYLTODRAFT_493187 [Cylindrobasidium torrendii FP15055 ss-10]
MVRPKPAGDWKYGGYDDADQKEAIRQSALDGARLEASYHGFLGAISKKAGIDLSTDSDIRFTDSPQFPLCFEESSIRDFFDQDFVLVHEGESDEESNEDISPAHESETEEAGQAERLKADVKALAANSQAFASSRYWKLQDGPRRRSGKDSTPSATTAPEPPDSTATTASQGPTRKQWRVYRYVDSMFIVRKKESSFAERADGERDDVPNSSSTEAGALSGDASPLQSTSTSPVGTAPSSPDATPRSSPVPSLPGDSSSPSSLSVDTLTESSSPESPLSELSPDDASTSSEISSPATGTLSEHLSTSPMIMPVDAMPPASPAEAPTTPIPIGRIPALPICGVELKVPKWEKNATVFRISKSLARTAILKAFPQIAQQAQFVFYEYPSLDVYWELGLCGTFGIFYRFRREQMESNPGLDPVDSNDTTASSAEHDNMKLDLESDVKSGKFKLDLEKLADGKYLDPKLAQKLSSVLEKTNIFKLTTPEGDFTDGFKGLLKEVASDARVQHEKFMSSLSSP